VPGQSRLPEPLESFVEELALCVATNGDKGPALLWPEDARSLSALRRLVRAGRPGTDGQGPAGEGEPPAAPGTGELAAALGRRLGLRVHPSCRSLAPRETSGPHGADGGECTLTVLTGACRCDVSRRSRPPARGAVLDTRLRSGDTLFVPRGHTYRLSDVHTPTLVLELALSDTV
jgi:hypothetical protein